MKNISLKITGVAIGLVFAGFTARSQNYTFKKGFTSIDMPGVYGAYGVAAPANMPGTRVGSASWKDANGNFWLFGGVGVDPSGFDILNDLWKYEPATNQWTLMKGDSVGFHSSTYGAIGIAAASNLPGARYSPVTWTDASGNFWMFGGNGVDNTFNAVELNELWKYNPTTNQWTWMKGSQTGDQGGTYGTQGTAAAANTPGGRDGAVSWADASGNLWLFGGYGFVSAGNDGELNDLWKYSIASNQWTWVNGSNTSVNQAGLYGTLGTASPTNAPGGRAYSSAWTDASGNLWLFGGNGVPANSADLDALNDLWKYNPTTSQWTWVSGSDQITQPGVYGTQGTASASNHPGARGTGFSWADASGNLWLFGGDGISNSAAIGTDHLNDLWKYNIAANQWTWIAGSSSIAQNGVYGAPGVSSPLNTPGGRGSGANWIDNAGTLWLFGGYGYDDSGLNADGTLGDLWKFGNCVSQTITIQGGGTVCAGTTATLTAGGASSYQWSTQQITGTINVAPTSNTSYTVQSNDPNACGNSASITLTVNPLPLIIASASASVACIGTSVTLSASGAGTYSWSNGQTGASVQAAAITTVYVVSGVDANGCKSTAPVSITANTCIGLKEYSSEASGLSVYPNPTNGKIIIAYSSANTSDVSTELYNTLGAHVATLAKGNNGVMEADLGALNIESGVYFISVNGNGVLSRQKIVYTK